MQIKKAVSELYDRIVDKNLLVRRVTISANHVIPESSVLDAAVHEQLNLFTDYGAAEAEKEKEAASLKREKEIQKAILKIKKKYGKNAILKGINLESGSTTIERNNQIGGHKK